LSRARARARNAPDAALAVLAVFLAGAALAILSFLTAGELCAAWRRAQTRVRAARPKKRGRQSFEAVAKIIIILRTS